MRAAARTAFCTFAFLMGTAAAAQTPTDTAAAQTPTDTAAAGSLTDQARDALSLGDRATSLRLTEQACDAGEATGCTLRGNIEPDATRRAEFLDRGCSRGDGTGCFLVMMAYNAGLGVKKDQKRARVLSEQSLTLSDSACSAGDSYACMTAGGIYAMDSKIASYMGAKWKQDLGRSEAAYKKGLEGIRMRCDAGSSFDCFAFAVAVTQGTGIEADPVGGAALLQASCDGGFPNACTMLGMSLVMGTGALAKDPARANALLERGCDGGDWGACQLKSSFLGAATLGDVAAARAGQSSNSGAPAASKPKFRIFRSVAGAAATYMAAKSVGASPDEALGAAAKATEMLNPDSEFAKQLGKAGEDMMVRGLQTRAANAAANASAGDAGASGGAAKAGSGASFATKPPFAGLAGACNKVGVTQQNFETSSFVKDGDVQLRTMCGSAYNYYRMYLNAIKQGYSEADCNRTYGAHAGSARVAIDFARRG